MIRGLRHLGFVAIVAGALSLAVASGAGAFHFSPVSTPFTATGTQNFRFGSTTYSCTVNMTFVTDAGGNGSFTGGTTTGSGLCPSTIFKAFPWAASATGATSVQVQSVSWQVAGVTTCGPSGSLVGTLGSNRMIFNATINGTCVYNVNLTFSPALSIVP